MPVMVSVHKPGVFTHKINTKGIIKQGRLDCRHYIVLTEAGPGHWGQHELGQCRYCGRTIDYTVLRGDLGWTGVYEVEKNEPE